MSNYTMKELEKTKTALTSTLRKCEKIQDGKKLTVSQQTLFDRRVHTFITSYLIIPFLYEKFN